MALVFQYGSNAHSDRLNSAERLRGDAGVVGIAYTQDEFELDFNVWSIGNACAAADIVPGAGRNIWGVLYEIPDYLIRRATSGNRRSLDAIEGEGTNYRRTEIAVRHASGEMVEDNPITYVVINRTNDLQTSQDYVRHILSGLQENDVPDDYIEYVITRALQNNPTLRF